MQFLYINCASVKLLKWVKHKVALLLIDQKMETSRVRLASSRIWGLNDTISALSIWGGLPLCWPHSQKVFTLTHSEPAVAGPSYITID